MKLTPEILADIKKKILETGKEPREMDVMFCMNAHGLYNFISMQAQVLMRGEVTERHLNIMSNTGEFRHRRSIARLENFAVIVSDLDSYSGFSIWPGLDTKSVRSATVYSSIHGIRDVKGMEEEAIAELLGEYDMTQYDEPDSY